MIVPLQITFKDLGPCDETLLVAIQRTNASASGLLQAFSCHAADDAAGPVTRRSAGPRVLAELEAAELRPERE